MSIIDSNYLRSIPIPIKDSQWDMIGEPQIQQAIDEAQEYILDYLDRRIASAYFTDRIEGPGRPRLVLEEYPVTYLQSVYSYDAHNIEYQHDTQEFIVLAAEGMVEWKDKVENMFARGRTYVINYQAGYYPVPVAIQKALAIQSIEMLQPLFRKTNSSMSMVDLIPNSTEMVVELLERYRRKRIG